MYRNPKADLLRAFSILQVDPSDNQTCAAIARALGMQWMQLSPQPLPVPAPAPPPGHTETAAGAVKAPAAPIEVGIEANLGAPLQFSMVQHEKSARMPPKWLERVEALPPPTAMAASLSSTEPYIPLFQAHWARAILSSALSVLRSDGPVDIRHIVETISRGEALRKLPLSRSSGIARGVQLLIDRSETMDPFAADVEWLSNKVRKVAGGYAFQQLQFRGCPSLGAGAGSRRTWKPYKELPTPRPGSVIAALTNLGMTRTVDEFFTDPAEWIAFSTHLKARGCSLIALTPYGRKRWPPELQRHITILHWDRRTTAATIRSQLRTRST